MGEINYYIKDLGNGWYSFKDIPQGYIKIDGVNCGTEEKARKQAIKILKNNGFDITKTYIIIN